MKTRVAHVFPSDSWGGAEIYSVDLAKNQMERGLDVLVWGRKDSPLLREAASRGLKTCEVYVPRRTEFRNLLKLGRSIKEMGITHLHVHWSGGIWAFFGIKLLCDVKLIYHVHLWISHAKWDPFHWVAHGWLDKVVVAGDRASIAAQRKLMISARKILVCPYAISYPEAVDRQRLDFEPHSFVFGMFGRIDKQKGTKEFLRALSRCVEKKLQVRGLVVGDPTRGENRADEYNSQVMETAELLSESSLKMLPYQTDFLSYLKACDVLVVPSYHESYSLMILYAFSLGIPVLSTDAGGTPDLINQDRGWLVVPRSEDALFEKMVQIASEPKVAAQKGGVAKEYVFENHSFDKIHKCISDYCYT